MPKKSFPMSAKDTCEAQYGLPFRHLLGSWKASLLDQGERL